jgi:hypothetical protein
LSAPTQPPTYKGEPLDGERGPGLGCFWIQIGLLVFFLVLTPLTVMWAWDSRISAVLLILTLVLLLFAGQTVIFLLRLVAADRRARRTPRSPDARPTVGQLEDQVSPTDESPATAADPSPTSNSAPALAQAPAPSPTPDAAKAPATAPAQEERADD